MRTTSPTAGCLFLRASLTYPNGAIVNFSGIDYVFAGGHAFGVANPTLLHKLRVQDHATVQNGLPGSVPPSNAPRVGTLLSTDLVNGKGTVYVVGTDGELHAFASSAQLGTDGYDPALVITVTSLAGLTVGSTAGVEGPAASALATSADGAIVDSKGAYYVFAGGRAFSIPNAALASIRKADAARVLTGTVDKGSTERQYR